jgi:DnaJ homolog subfamily C member 2
MVPLRWVELIARQKRHHRTFSEDERIQAQENVRKVEDDDNGEISEPEDPLMLQRDAKDWKVHIPYSPFHLTYAKCFC